MITELSRLRSAKLQVLSRGIFTLPMHYVGRTVPCAGPGCPACDFRGPRRIVYVGVRVPGKTGVLEACPSLAAVLVRARERLSALDYLGLCVEIRRSSVRKPWELVRAELRQLTAPVLTETDVAKDLATLFRLTLPVEGETVSHWFARVRGSQARILADAHLF